MPNTFVYLVAYILVILAYALLLWWLWARQPARSLMADTFIKVYSTGITAASILIPLSSGLLLYVMKEYEIHFDFRNPVLSPIIAAIIIFLFSMLIGVLPLSSIATQEKDGKIKINAGTNGRGNRAFPVTIGMLALSIGVGALFIIVFLAMIMVTKLVPKASDTKTPEKTVQRIYTTLFFGPNKSAITADHVLSLDQLIGALKVPGIPIEITGYADSTGSDDHNLTLSQQRVESVKNHLIARGIQETSIRTRFFGERNPAGLNDTPAGRQGNRRVVLRSIAH